jgi:hypothetical protein
MSVYITNAKKIPVCGFGQSVHYHFGAFSQFQSQFPIGLIFGVKPKENRK